MAETLNATAANIISSLGIKGATVRENLAGFVPVLDENGKINAKLIPSDYADIAATPLSNVVYVDPYTSVSEYGEDGTRRRTGSCIAPFKSISEAVRNFEPNKDAKNGLCFALVLSPGTYLDTSVSFADSKSGFSPKIVILAGTGVCTFGATAFSFSGLDSSGLQNPSVVLQNVRISTVNVQYGADVVVAGRSSLANLTFADGWGGKLSMSSESRVDSTNAASVEYLSDAYMVGYSGVSAGKTAGDALDSLGRRRIRLASVTAGSDGFEVGSSFDDVAAESSGDGEFYDLSERDRMLVEGINRLVSKGKDIVADSVTASDVYADSIRTSELRMDYLSLGGYRLSIDAYGYLVINDSSSTTPVPPDNLVLLRDTVDGTLYVLGVASGRMYLAEASEGDESSEPVEKLEVYDPETKTSYVVTVEDGRLTIRKSG